MQASCPHCGQNYDVGAELLGKQVQCSTCTKPFNLPAAPDGAAASTPAASTPAASTSAAESSGPVEVACPHCDARFQAPPQLLGTSANCPTCQQSFIVEKADAELALAPADDGLDPFGGLAGDPLGAPTSPLGSTNLSSAGSALGSGSAGRARAKSSSDSDNSTLWLGVAKILGGILMGVFGVVATMASYEAAREGESYTMYHGLVIGGVALFFYGVRDIYVHSQS